MSIIKPKAFWPLTVDATNKVIYFHEATAGNLTANIAEAVYTSAETFRAAVQTTMRAAHANVNAIVVAVSSAGIFSFTNGTQTHFRWSSTTNSAAALLGYTNADTAANVVQTALFQHANGFYSPVAVAVDSLPIRDRQDDVVTRTKQGQTKHLAMTELGNRDLIFRWLGPEYTYKAFEDTTAKTNRAIERLWESGRAKFRYWPDGLTEGTYFDYSMDLDTIKEYKVKRQFTKKGLYEVEFGLFLYVS